MKLTVERLPESRVSLDIAADEAEFAQAIDRAARRVANQLQIPGFRKGKAPKAMIERMYGREAFVEEANRTLMTDLYQRAVQQEDLIPVGDPEVEMVSADPLAFKVVTAVYPTVEPGNYLDLRIDQLDAAVTDEEIDEVVENLRKDNSPWVDPPSDGMTVGADKVLTPQSRLPQDGDQITIDVRSQTAGDDDSVTDEEDVVFVLGESGLLDELDTAIKTLRVGDSTTTEVSFGEDEERANAEVRGKTITYTITLKALKERDLVPLDDDLAKAAGDLDTLEALREQVSNNLHREKTERLGNEGFQALLEKALAETDVVVPAAMVDRELHDELHNFEHRLSHQGMSLDGYLRLSEQTQDELEAELRPAVEKRLKAGLLMEAIARKEEIQVPQERFAAMLNFMVSPQMTGSPERSRELLRDREFLSNIQRDIRDSMTRERLIEIATEGKGMVANAWVRPAPAPAAEAETTDADAGDDGETALDAALTTGAMPGQPGDLGEETTLAVTAEDEADAAGFTPAPEAEDDADAAAHPTI